VQVRLLGPIDVLVDGVPRPVAGLRRRAVVAALALQPGQILSVDQLVEVVWGENPPAKAAITLQSHLSQLRRAVGDPTVVLARPPGYVLNIAGPATDVQAAEQLIREATRSADPARAAAQLQDAVALWRGRALADLAELAWFNGPAQRLEQLLLQARHALIDARLSLGQHLQLVPQLHDLIQQYPLHEPAYGQLMLALYRAGRQDETLAAYQRLYRALDDNLGVAPSRALRDLHAAVLRQDPALDPPAAPSVAPAPRPRAVALVPAQLPPATATFTGRARELDQLDALLDGADHAGAGRPAAVVVSAVSGTAGVGKTALAVHWAHRVAAHFPDGQLYVNLRGFDQGGSVANPADALRGFLDALRVPAEHIPAELSALAGLYRSRLAGKRVLVVLDNARDVEQVRPLLPGSPGCMAVVTSRNRLTPLVVTDGAHPLTVDLLTVAEARDLLTHRLGADRVAREPDAVDEIVARCARLPLALAIAAARAVTYPDFPLAHLAAELRDITGWLDTLHGGDPYTDVRAVFSWSYRTLSVGAARLFRLLGPHPGPDLTAAAATSLTGLAPQPAGVLLIELTRAHLLTEHAPGRYAAHDLLREYATELAHTHDSDAEQRAALHRILDHYLHTAYTAARLLNPARTPIDLAPPGPGVIPERLDSHDGALSWFTAEQSVLLSAVERAAAAGFGVHTWQLAWTLTEFMRRRSLWREQVTVQHIALRAARGVGDRVGQGHIHRGLAKAYHLLGELDDAEIHFRHADQLYAELDDPTGRGHAYTGLVTLAEQRGDLTGALLLAQRALQLYRLGGDPVWHANGLNGVGWFHTQLGDHHQALAYCQQALPLLQEAGYREAEAATWDSLGYAHRGLADYARSASCYQRAVDVYRDLGDGYGVADVLNSLGDTHHAAGDLDTAHKTWHEALGIFAELGHPDADKVTAKLRR
jgi:DNA-binding SARP family transcriptional activator